MELGRGRVTGHRSCGTCKSCSSSIGRLDAAIDGLCALCRIDLPLMKCIECGRKSLSTRERWIFYRGYLYCPLCAETTE